MVLALATFGLILLAGIILYGILWWENATVGLKFTKWYFILLLVVAVVAAILAGISGYNLME
ncbi:hypothetical protein [Paenibacillus agaridevorans]|uniref:hypothetical protein n=1 Tax=Paenibacillus agaridevorans TaxID=171404 RepID=UPI001BE4A533|nr:hypothetical protein [Paenibacillus agaridevorans]